MKEEAMGEQEHIEGETLGQYRARHGLPGTDTGAAHAITWRGGMWRNEHGSAATSAATPESEGTGANVAGDAAELEALLLALRPAIPLVLGWFDVSSPAYRLARAVALLTRERAESAEIDAMLRQRIKDLEGSVGKIGDSLIAALARVAELEAAIVGMRGERDDERVISQEHEARADAAEERVAELEAMLTAPPVGSVAGLLAKVDEARSVASSKGANHAGESAMAYRYEGMRDAFDIARDLIRSTLAAPADAVGKVVAEVLRRVESIGVGDAVANVGVQRALDVIRSTLTAPADALGKVVAADAQVVCDCDPDPGAAERARIAMVFRVAGTVCEVCKEKPATRRGIDAQSMLRAMCDGCACDAAKGGA